MSRLISFTSADRKPDIDPEIMLDEIIITVYGRVPVTFNTRPVMRVVFTAIEKALRKLDLGIGYRVEISQK